MCPGPLFFALLARPWDKGEIVHKFMVIDGDGRKVVLGNSFRAAPAPGNGTVLFGAFLRHLELENPSPKSQPHGRPNEQARQYPHIITFLHQPAQRRSPDGSPNTANQSAGPSLSRPEFGSAMLTSYVPAPQWRGNLARTSRTYWHNNTSPESLDQIPGCFVASGRETVAKHRNTGIIKGVVNAGPMDPASAFAEATADRPVAGIRSNRSNGDTNYSFFALSGVTMTEFIT